MRPFRWSSLAGVSESRDEVPTDMLIGPPWRVRARPCVVLVLTGIVGGVNATRVGSTTSPGTGASSSTPNWTRRRHPITLYGFERSIQSGRQPGFVLIVSEVELRRLR